MRTNGALSNFSKIRNESQNNKETANFRRSFGTLDRNDANLKLSRCKDPESSMKKSGDA
jgi:hypothetical protein